MLLPSAPALPHRPSALQGLNPPAKKNTLSLQLLKQCDSALPTKIRLFK